MSHPIHRSCVILAMLSASCVDLGSDPAPELEDPITLDSDPAPVDPPADAGTDLYPLLGSARGGHYWNDFCEGQPDDTVVPEDPRHMVVPGVNEGKAVHMNGHWQTCQPGDHPGTCGELRARIEAGFRLVAGNGHIGAGTTFHGDSGDPGLFTFGANNYNRVWMAWGFDERPENFDELAAQRWGTALAPYGNPYPLPGEDPNLTNGGSGRLPMALTQLREPDGTWTGLIGVTCNVCHGGRVGEPSDGPGLGSLWGMNSLSDMTVMYADLGLVAPMMSSLAVFSMNKVRGTGNITNFQFFGVLELTGHIAEAGPSILAVQDEPSTGTEDPPIWWNMGHRVNKFYDGAQVIDSKRIELSFHLPGAPIHGIPLGSEWEEHKQWILDNVHSSDAWMTSLRSPAWPEGALGDIDVALAEEGAVLFHTKNLWAPALNNPVREPDGGNGSCASCHGAYSPRYVHDPAFLDSPLLEGIAANITPIDIINTDSKRLDGNNQEIVDASRNMWFAYNDGPFDADGNPLCGNWNDPAMRGDRELGYLAQPLYGIWASAPYFHNGSVPTVRQVLRSDERPGIWRRVSTPAPAGQEEAVMGFATDLEYYDANALGWEYESLPCGPWWGVQNCLEPVPETIGDGLATFINTGLLFNFVNIPPYADVTIENRKIYNTHRYSQGNSGHEFSDVLTEHEVVAILEYLKTL